MIDGCRGAPSRNHRKDGGGQWNSVALQARQPVIQVAADPKADCQIYIKPPVGKEDRLTLMEKDKLKAMVAQELERYKKLAAHQFQIPQANQTRNGVKWTSMITDEAERTRSEVMQKIKYEQM